VLGKLDIVGDAGNRSNPRAAIPFPIEMAPTQPHVVPRTGVC